MVCCCVTIFLPCFCPGLDYVGHEDVLPYKTTEKQPIQNHLFDKFLSQDEESGKFSIGNIVVLPNTTVYKTTIGNINLVAKTGWLNSYIE